MDSYFRESQNARRYGFRKPIFDARKPKHNPAEATSLWFWVHPSMRIAPDDLKLENLVVLYPGKNIYPLSDKVTVVPLTMVGKDNAEAIFLRHKQSVRRKVKSR
jgi:hypothetical protein